MKKLLLLFSALALSVFAQSADTAVFVAALSPDNEVPAITGYAASGTAVLYAHAVRDAQGQIVSGSVDFVVFHNFPDTPTVTGLHVHNGPAGANAGVVINTGLSGANPLVITAARGIIERQAQVLATLPDTLLPISPITEKDRADLDYALRLGVDWIALSFVQRAEDIHLGRQLIGQGAAIMAKIEKPSAITDLDNIIAAVDGVMVARGDLGVEMPVERVPGLQKEITRKARAAGKPVVIATQMLESMISSPVPTRAEVSDVATAVFDGADAIMLSAESSVGQFPMEAIQMMDRIAIEVEKDPSYEAIVHTTQTKPQATGADAIAAAARAIADTVKLSAIICYTATGSTALRVARERPNLPVIGLTPVLATGRRLSIVWGTHCVLTSDPENLADMVRKACRIAFEEEFAKPRDGILITAGVPLGSPGATNMVRMAFLDETGAPVAEGV